jgi:hypothetical protein
MVRLCASSLCARSVTLTELAVDLYIYAGRNCEFILTTATMKIKKRSHHASGVQGAPDHRHFVSNRPGIVDWLSERHFSACVFTLHIRADCLMHATLVRAQCLGE